MPHKIELKTVKISPGAKIDCFTSACISIEVCNLEPEPLVLDGELTQLYFEVIDAASGTVLLKVDEQLRLSMLYLRNIQQRKPPIIINANASRVLTFDLAKYYYPFKVGTYKIQPCFQHPDGELQRGKFSVLEVSSTKLIQARCWFENPIFGNQNLLTIAESDANVKSANLRWLGTSHPLASFYNMQLPELSAKTSIIPALPAFWDVEDFSPAFQRTLLIYEDSQLTILKIYRGKLVEKPKVFNLDQAGELLGSAIRNEQGDIYFCTRSLRGSESVVCGYHVNTLGDVEFLFSRNLKGAQGPIAICGSHDAIHIYSAEPELTRTSISYTGSDLGSLLLIKNKGKLIKLKVDLFQNRINAVFEDIDKPRILWFLQTDANNVQKKPQIQALSFSTEQYGKLVEIEFLIDLKQGLHVLRTGNNSNLDYIGPDKKTLRLCQNESRYFPCLLAGNKENPLPFAGFARRNEGYRFHRIGGLNQWKQFLNQVI